MSEGQETVDDIIAEKRRQADEIERDCAEKMKRGEMVSDCYARELVAATRNPDNGFSLGASPRALLDLARCAQAHALLKGRTFVTPDDVSSLAGPVLTHRLILNQKSRHAGVSASDLVAAIVKKTHVPV